MQKTKQVSRSKWVMGWVVAIFLLPLMVSGYLYLHHHQLLKTIESGVIIQPPITLHTKNWKISQTQAFNPSIQRHKWQLLYVTQKQCNLHCIRELNLLTRVHQALGASQKRVVLIALNLESKPPKKIDAKTSHQRSLYRVYASQSDWLSLFAHSHVKGEIPVSGKLFVIDPMQKIMMSYQAPIPNEGLLKDIKRLLRVSHIG